MAHVTYDQSIKQVNSDSYNNLDQTGEEIVEEMEVFDISDLEISRESRTVFSEENPEKQECIIKT